MQSDNPAARLLEILKKGHKYKTEENCGVVWKKILGDVSDNSILMSRMGKLMSLPNEIVEFTSREFPNHDISSQTYWSNHVNNGFMTQDITGKWGTFFNHIDQHTLSYLELIADLIQSKVNTSLLDEATLSDIRSKINDILVEVIEGDFEEEIKLYIATSLKRILVCIDEYHLTGAMPIMEAMETSLGHAFYDEKYKQALSQTGLGKRIIDVLVAVSAAVTIAVGYPQLPEAFKMLLK